MWATKSSVFHFTLITTVIVYWALTAAKMQVTYKPALCRVSCGFRLTICVDTDKSTQAAAALQTRCLLYKCKSNGVWVGLRL